MVPEAALQLVPEAAPQLEPAPHAFAPRGNLDTVHHAWHHNAVCNCCKRWWWGRHVTTECRRRPGLGAEVVLQLAHLQRAALNQRAELVAKLVNGEAYHLRTSRGPHRKGVICCQEQGGEQQSSTKQGERGGSGGLH